MKDKSTALKLTQSAAIAALYVVLTVIFAPISFGEMQVRVSEALTILPLFTLQPSRVCSWGAYWGICWAERSPWT